jgi:hypothetical protein
MMSRAIALVILAAVAGPPLAAALFLVVGGLFRFGPPALAGLGETLGLAVTPYTWLIALVPALIAGIANAVALRLVPRETLRLLAALPLGAAPYLLLLNWLAVDEATGSYVAGDLAALGIAGAVASLVCVALVETVLPARTA